MRVGAVARATAAAAILAGVLGAPVACAQSTPGIYWQCVPGATPSWCPAGQLYPLPVEQTSGNYSHLAANGTTVLKAGPGVLHTVTINTAGATDTITLYDNTAGSGTKIATINSTQETTLVFNVRFSTGLTVVIAGTTAPDVTISWQ